VTGPLRLLGRVLGGLTVIACVIGWACWVWLSGAQWHRNWRGRRWLTRPVRATLQTGTTAVVFGLVLAPVATATVLATLGLTLVGTAAAWRYRLHLDQRADARTGLVSVIVGRPVPNRPRPGTRRSTAPRRELATEPAPPRAVAGAAAGVGGRP
jgi:hypothetical protein